MVRGILHICLKTARLAHLHAVADIARLLRTHQRPLLAFSSSKMELPPMSSHINPTTGAAEWVVEDESYDFHQEIARSAYTDMLHDDERNKKYYEGIKRAVAIIRERGQEVRVLDIGTGTGLLAMMAASCGADSVHACEAFRPIADAAKKIIAKNGFGKKITVIPKRSTEVTVGPDGDMPARANILAAEVFDTELIGEGAVPTYLHAHRHLLTDDCICVPHSATVFAQVVQSDTVWQWHKLQPIRIPGRSDIIPHPEMDSCAGAASVHDLQLSQLSPDQFRPITDPLSMIGFNFTKGDFLEHRANSITCRSLLTGECQGVFMWWELSMDTEGEVTLSTAPSWCHVDGDRAPWRDHWMQAVYFLDQAVPVNEGDPLTLNMTHDDYSQWFEVKKEADSATMVTERPICRCGAHVVWSRPRFGMLNDRSRMEKFNRVLEKMVTKDTVCLGIGDGSMLPLVAAKLGAEKVYSLESSSLCHRVMSSLIRANNLSSEVKLLRQRAQDLREEHLEGNKVDLILSEPFFVTSLLPWHNLYLWYAIASLRPLLAPNVRLLPSRARLMGVAVQFDNLWKFHAPVETLEGFDVRIFDDLVQKASECSDAATEPHHLWEYPGQALTQEFAVMTFDFSKDIPMDKMIKCGRVGFTSSGTCHGVALWMEYRLDEATVISTGLQKHPEGPGGEMIWDMHSKQGVHFIKSNPRVEAENGDRLDFDATFNPSSGNIHFNFIVQSNPR